MSGWPTSPGALTAAADAGRAPPAPGSPGSRGGRVSAARSRPAALPEPAARRPAGRRRRGPGRRRRRVGRRRACPTSAGRDADAILAAAAAGELGGLVVGGVDPDDLRRPGRRPRGARRRVGFVVSLEVRESDGDRARRRRPPGRAGRREGRHLRRLGGPGRGRSTRCCATPAPLTDARVLAGIAEELGAPLGFRTVAEVRAPRWPSSARWDGDRADARRRLADGRPRSAAGAGEARAGDLAAAARRRPAAGRRRADLRGDRPHAGRRGSSPATLRGARRRRRATGHASPADRGSVDAAGRRRATCADGVVWAAGELAGQRRSRHLRRPAGRRGLGHGERGRRLMIATGRRWTPPTTSSAFGHDPWWLVLIKAVLIFVILVRADAVHHLVRAPRRRPDAAAHRPQRARPVRPAAEPRRRREAGAQGGHHPEGGRQGRSSSSRRSSRRSRRSWPSR